MWCGATARAVRGPPGLPQENKPEYKETLRRLALNDERLAESVLGVGHDTVEISRLDQTEPARVSRQRVRVTRDAGHAPFSNSTSSELIRESVRAGRCLGSSVPRSL